MPREIIPSHWKCGRCHGTGWEIPFPGHTDRCPDCDGTGNALVDGDAARHAREVARIRADKQSNR